MAGADQSDRTGLDQSGRTTLELRPLSTIGLSLVCAYRSVCVNYHWVKESVYALPSTALCSFFLWESLQSAGSEHSSLSC